MKTKINFLLMICISLVMMSCNDIRLSISFDRLQGQTDLLVRVSNARPNVRLKVIATNVPQHRNQEVYVTTDSEGSATARFEYRFQLSGPNYCDLSPSEKRQRGLAVAHDESNPDSDQRVSRVREFGISPLFYHPGSGCDD